MMFSSYISYSNLNNKYYFVNILYNIFQMFLQYQEQITNQKYETGWLRRV